jgi:hypothetical protein
MSADNWTLCPKCLKTENNKRAKQVALAKKSYGVVPPDEYAKLIEEANAPIAMQDTLREDYEFSMYDDGTFEASYRAGCNSCGFKHEFEAREQVKI